LRTDEAISIYNPNSNTYCQTEPVEVPQSTSSLIQNPKKHNLSV